MIKQKTFTLFFSYSLFIDYICKMFEQKKIV